ncbi:hypothetical protein [Amycolatopsis sacchari]|uniref:hypothetical protein n=1 Tax=Amycolatopsis sacchari TaxID=115433 RepID=UPI003D71FF61
MDDRRGLPSWRLPGAGRIAALSLSVSAAVVVVLVTLGLTAPTGTHPFFYLGLACQGGGAASLLFGGVGVVVARDRTPTIPALDAEFFAGVRRLVLAMWWCALVTNALGILIMLSIADGAGGDAPIPAPRLAATFAVAVVTMATATTTSVSMRRILPRG